MDERDPVAILSRLVTTGALNFVYVIGVARSNSTLVCRILGAQLDGAVYEPAMPVALAPPRQWAAVIVSAYEQARLSRAATGPVMLAIKDLSLFVDAEAFRLIAAHAAHIVFTIRDPVSQYISLKQQFRHEFTLAQRLDALFHYPAEVGWLTVLLFRLGPGMVREAARVCGLSLADIPELAVAGWNLRSWSAIARQFEAVAAADRGGRVTVIDAGRMRARPEAAMAVLNGLAGDLAGGRRGSSLEIAGHSRMLPRSRWAAEALSSMTIKPAAEAGPATPSPIALRLDAVVNPIYRRLLESSVSALRPAGVAAAEGGPVV
jgi:hypothetical protein